MKTIVIAGHKGGLGKTTIAVLLAQFASQQKKAVKLIDLDPQQSLFEWWNQRPEDDLLEVVDVDYQKLEEAKTSLENIGTDFLIIDTPPAHQEIIKASISSADIVITPCSPSPLDVKGIGETITILENQKKPFFFVMNRSITGTNISAEILPLLAQYGKVAPSSLALRVDYAQGFIGGNTPLDMGNKQVKKEVEALYTYLSQQIKKL